MRSINFEHRQGVGFQITDYPNAEKVIALSGGKAQELADMALHMSDLILADEYLDLSIKSEDGSICQRASWRMAIITFIKCFSNNKSRPNTLDINQIIPNDELGIEVFLYFKNLRNKNVVHDENPIDQCLVGAIINKEDAQFKVEQIVTMNVRGEVNANANVSNLMNLIKVTREYVEQRYNNLCDELTSELEILSHTELIKRGVLTYSKPIADDVSKSRKVLGAGQ